MSITFGGVTLVSDSGGAYHGIAKMVRGTPALEMARRSFPRGAGIVETYIGKRERVIEFRVHYMTTSEATLVALVEGYKDHVYRTLVAPRGTFTYCRLDDIDWGECGAGTRGDGTAITIFPATILRFVQVYTG